MKFNKLTEGKNLLWESSRMMLPEHKEQILQYRSKLNYKQKPLLDEQRLEELSEAMIQALELQSTTLITLYDPLHPVTVQGRIQRIDPLLRRLRIIEEKGNPQWISLEDIIDLSISESGNDL